jgi:predicted methyltransferase MtxX (methanogen marker protein 4)
MIPTIENLAEKANAKIAIGVSKEERLQQKTISGALHVKNRGFAQPVLVGSNIKEIDGIEAINTPTPEQTLLDLLISKKVQGVVRGSFKAHTTMKVLKKKIKDFTTSDYIRIALIQHPLSDKAINLSPVGIEEGRDINSKKLIIFKGVELLELIGVVPKINLLSAGIFPDDLGRDSFADDTINSSIELIKFFKEKNNLNISTNGILIEKALEEGANLILSPNGIAGNLLYRTLVHVADWKSFGSVLSFKDMKFSDFVYVDTSSIGTVHEYRRALTFASALTIL